MTEEEEVNYNRERMLAKAWARAEEHLVAVRTVLSEMESAGAEGEGSIVRADYAKGYHEATERWRKRLMQALEPPMEVGVSEWSEESSMIYIAGAPERRSFRCTCGANVFTQHKHDQSWYRCNGCKATYTGLSVAESEPKEA